MTKMPQKHSYKLPCYRSKVINFNDDIEDYQQTERISPELMNGYRLEYALFSCSKQTTTV